MSCLQLFPGHTIHLDTHTLSQRNPIN
jgi:hypothetical protein